MNVMTLADVAFDLRHLGEVNVAGLTPTDLADRLVESALDAGVRVLVFEPWNSPIHLGQYEDIYFDFAQEYGSRFEYAPRRARRRP